MAVNQKIFDLSLLIYLDQRLTVPLKYYWVRRVQSLSLKDRFVLLFRIDPLKEYFKYQLIFLNLVSKVAYFMQRLLLAFILMGYLIIIIILCCAHRLLAF